MYKDVYNILVYMIYDTTMYRQWTTTVRTDHERVQLERDSGLHLQCSYQLSPRDYSKFKPRIFKHIVINLISIARAWVRTCKELSNFLTVIERRDRLLPEENKRRDRGLYRKRIVR